MALVAIFFSYELASAFWAMVSAYKIKLAATTATPLNLVLA